MSMISNFRIISRFFLSSAMQYIEKSIVLSGASTYQAYIYVYVLVLVLVLGHFHSIWIHTDEEDRMLWSLGKELTDALVSGLFTRC